MINIFTEDAIQCLKAEWFFYNFGVTKKARALVVLMLTAFILLNSLCPGSV